MAVQPKAVVPSSWMVLWDGTNGEELLELVRAAEDVTEAEVVGEGSAAEIVYTALSTEHRAPVGAWFFVNDFHDDGTVAAINTMHQDDASVRRYNVVLEEWV